MPANGSDLREEYRRRTKESERLYRRARRVFAGGVNHNARFYEPYPEFFSKAVGKHVWDEDGNRLTDYWMGHTALILGHSPKVVVDAVKAQLGRGTLYGMSTAASVDLAEEIKKCVPCAEMLRFCNTGAEATMYMVRLARAHTRRRLIVKISGGWHGYNTQLNKGVHLPGDGTEGAGILDEEQAHVVTIPFNDQVAAEVLMRADGDDVAAVILEPLLGAGGCIPADKEYLRSLRELTGRHGSLLAFDEIITGFRLALGGAQEFYGVEPDLASFGKIVGGGFPIGLVCGASEIISLADPGMKDRSKFVSIGGGTFSENPMTVTAGLATVRHLRKQRRTIYGRLSRMGSGLRREVDSAFEDARVDAHTTGEGSLFATHFTKQVPRSPEAAAKGDAEKQLEYGIGLIANGVFVLPRHAGAISTVHTEADVREFIEKTEKLALRLRKKS